jgi:tRNA 2-thiouridine synthesizing protein E
MDVDVNGKTIALSEAGWLLDLTEWTPAVAEVIARDVEKVELTPEHWDVINETRAYFDEFGTVPEQRVFAKVMKEKYGPERATQQYFYRLFPYGLVKSANKIGGLPRPKGCS